MSKILFFLALFSSVNYAFSQRLVSDKAHLAEINTNATVRLAAELGYQASIDKVNQNTNDINLNLASVVLVQNMIHRSMTEVNEALKDAIMIKQLGYLIKDIFKNSHDALQLAKGNPILMLFAEDIANQLKLRGVKMANNVSSFILTNGEDILINYNVRDELISNIVKELQIINAMIYTIKQNMYWAKERGLIKSFNPWAQMVVDDNAKLNEIIWRRKSLKR